MPLQEIQAPRDYLTSNLWLLEIDGEAFASFSNISGIAWTVGSNQRTDGGTGIGYTFPNQQQSFGQWSLTRQRDPEDPQDARISELAIGSREEGTKYSGQIIKLHHGVVVFRIRFYGMLFLGENHPNLNKDSGAGYDMSYNVSVDFWEEIPASA